MVLGFNIRHAAGRQGRHLTTARIQGIPQRRGVRPHRRLSEVGGGGEAQGRGGEALAGGLPRQDPRICRTASSGPASRPSSA
ncbi:MAG: hypothetical protein MZV70_44520 [Desulfobacterales bacterium]|nr:hypothetical protein [Desulfobacterales bacterium]